jgi:Co/Zn/Cd efflux system component
MGKARAQRWKLERAKHRKLLWMAFTVMQAAFVIDIAAGLLASSAALQLDALETVNTKTVTESIVKPRYSAGQEKLLNTLAGVFALLLCCWTVGVAIWNYVNRIVPNATIMAATGGLVFIANAVAFGLLFSQRVGSTKMWSAWCGARNDMIGAGIILSSAAGVWLTDESWPDALALALILPFAAFRAIATMRSA